MLLSPPTPDTALYHLVLPWPTPSNNEIKGMNRFVYQRLRRQWQGAVWAALNGKLPAAPLEQSRLVIHRHCGNGGLDWDNCYGGIKPLLDCLVMKSKRNPDGLGLIRDDSPKSMPEPPYIRQFRASPGKGRTEVFIYAVSSADGEASPW